MNNNTDKTYLNMTVREFIGSYYALFDGCHSSPFGLIHKTQMGMFDEFVKQNPTTEAYIREAIPCLKIMSNKELVDFLEIEKENCG